MLLGFFFLRDTNIITEKVPSNQGLIHIGRPVCFVFERAKAPRQFLLDKGHPMWKLYISTGAFKGTEAMTKKAWRQLPPLPP